MLNEKLNFESLQKSKNSQKEVKNMKIFSQSR